MEPITVLAIPRAAVLSDQQGDYVYVVDAQNKAQRRPIQLGQSTPSTAVVSNGLKEGELVISEGLQRVRPGEVVSPGPASPPPPIAPQTAAQGQRRTAVRSTKRDRRPAAMISAIFVDRPRLAVVIAIVITIAGLLALTRIPVAQFPDIVPPQTVVSATYPGASAAVVESSVAQPIEAQVVGVDKMIYMSSTSGNDGSYNLTVSFVLGSDPDINTNAVNNRVQTALAQLPPEVQLEGLTIQKKSSAVLQFLMLYSENGEQDPLFITNYAIINVLDVLSRTPGVGQARLFGALNYSMRIWFDTQRLDNLQLTPADVIAAIQAQNVEAPVGRIGARPIGKDQQFQLNVQTQGRLTTPEQFGNIVLRANPDGSLLRVRDVARVDLGAQNQDIEGRLNGEPAVAIGVYLSPGANAVQTAAQVRANLDRLSQRFPPGLKYLVNYDTTTFVQDTIHDVLITLLIAFVLVVIVVFVFLGSLRATLIPAIAVPVSVIGSLRRAAGDGLFGQHDLAARDGAGDRHPGRRRHRRRRERRTRHGGKSGTLARGRDKKGDDRDHRADHRDHLGPAFRVRADRLHPRHLGNTVPAIRGDDQRRDADLGLECPDIVAGAVRGVSAPRRPAARPDGLGAAAHRQYPRRLRGDRAPPGARLRIRGCGDTWRVPRGFIF